MSSHLSVYIGPFFLVPKVVTEWTTETRCCSTPACLRPADSFIVKFCSACGGPIVSVAEKTKEEGYPSHDDLDGNWTDVVATARLDDGTEVWLPNKVAHGLSVYNGIPTALLLLENVVVADEKARFLKDYQALATAFETQFGPPLEVSFGVVPYYS